MNVAVLVASALTALLVRQLFVLAAVGRSRRFLATPSADVNAASEGGPTFFVVVPVLRETAVIAETTAHLQALASEHLAQVVVVTTAREQAESSTRRAETGTVTLVEQLATTGKFIHLHYPDPLGLKGDQLNFAAAYCASTLLGDVPAEDAFLVCYDADSRPPLDSLPHFEQAIARFPEASVFHQSSRFELRDKPLDQLRSPLGWLARAVCDGGALRANRFVLGFEIPRLLNRSSSPGPRKRAACSYVYAHVTGHGLCVRLSALLTYRSPTAPR